MELKAGMISASPSPGGRLSDPQEGERNVFGVAVKVVDREQALAEIRQVIVEKGHCKYAFLNANGANLAWKNKSYRDVLSRFQVLADGVGVDIASKLLYGRPFPANLNGTDFLPALFDHIEQPLKVGLIGARSDVVNAAAANLSKRHPAHDFDVIHDGYFSDEERPAILDRVANLKPEVLLVALGNPAQEVWIDQYCNAQHANVVIGVGALFDFLARRVPRAPKGWRRLRIEWMYRLLLEPRRLWRRYLLGNPAFIARILIQKFARRDLGH